MKSDSLKGCELHMVEMILGEIIEKTAPIDWNDIAGLDFAKNTIREVIINPILRPDIFTGIRAPPKGLLLFGPPGTGYFSTIIFLIIFLKLCFFFLSRKNDDWKSNRIENGKHLL